MAEEVEQKPVESEKTDEPKAESQQTVPLTDLIALRNSAKREREKLRGQLAELEKQKANLETELKVATLQGGQDDDEVKQVRAHLLKEKQEVIAEKSKYDREMSAFAERERALRAKELVAEYRERGVKIAVDELLAEDDMDNYATHKYIKHLETKAGQPVKTAEAQVFESVPANNIKQSLLHMSDKEFADYERKLKAKAGY